MAPEADHPESAATIAPHERGRRGAERALGVRGHSRGMRGDPAAQGQHNTECVVGDLGNAIVRRIADRYPSLSRRFEIDVIDPNTGADNDSATIERGDEVAVDGGNVPVHDRVSGGQLSGVEVR